MSVCAMLLVLGKETDTVGLFGGILILVQCLFLSIPIIPTEIALKRNFDEYGNRKV